MRLIDADALKQGFESSDFDDDSFENVDNACRIVNSYPTIPAIPIDWLDSQIRGYASALMSTELKALTLVKQMWEKEHEAR